MADKFTEALEELKDALTNGEELEAALVAVAADHDVMPEALRNRATLRWGDLDRRANELTSSTGAALERKFAVSRLRKARNIYFRLYHGSASPEEINWLLAYRIGYDRSAESIDKAMIRENLEKI